jgi:hypothetical protein
VPDVLRVETRVVDPVFPPPSLDVTAAERGRRQAIAASGAWPEDGTYAQYADAIARAGREVDRVEELWNRWARRCGRLGDPIEDGPPRLGARFHVAHETLMRRQERLSLLLCAGLVGGRQ